MPWNAILDWLQANWLGLLTLVVVTSGAIISWLHFRRSKRDVTPRVYFASGDCPLQQEIEVHQVGEDASPFTFQLLVVNLGGTKLNNGKLTLTLPDDLEAVDSTGWREDTPNALVQGGSAVGHQLPTMGRNDRHETPPLTVHDPKLRREASSHLEPYRLRWEVWSGKEGLGSADLMVSFRLKPAPK